MGTRADFYVGCGTDAEWLGSIAWDGYPSGVDMAVIEATSEADYRAALKVFFDGRDDVTLPDMGWPWPWETSHTTDYAYAFFASNPRLGGQVWASSFGEEWWPAITFNEADDDDRPKMPPNAFPDMSDRKNVQIGGKRSGLIVVSAPIEETE